MATVKDPTGTTIGEVAIVQYPFTPLAPRQGNISCASATGLTPPAGAIYAIVQAKVANINYTLDGQTAPTAGAIGTSTGMTLYAGSALTLSGAAMIAAFKAIAQTAGAVFDAEYSQ
jgi:hypothetical protein